jgi:hypothetical protein
MRDPQMVPELIPRAIVVQFGGLSRVPVPIQCARGLEALHNIQRRVVINCCDWHWLGNSPSTSVCAVPYAIALPREAYCDEAKMDKTDIVLSAQAITA